MRSLRDRRGTEVQRCNPGDDDAHAFGSPGRAGQDRGDCEGKAAGIAEGKAAGIAEGKAAGIAEGKAAGKADTLLRQARLRFGEVSAAREAEIRSAPTEQLDAWSEALILASDLNAVFEGPSRH